MSDPAPETTPPPESSAGQGECPAIVDVLRVRLGSWAFRASSLSTEARRLAHWISDEVLPEIEHAGLETVRLTVTGDDAISLSVPGHQLSTGDLTDCKDVCALLRNLEIADIEIGHRLESNQIVDVLTLLYVNRRRIARRQPAGSRTVRELLSPDGVHFACTQTAITGQTLKIFYSYCTLRYSRLVAWFERQDRHFGDHRALFRAAPLLSLLPPLILVGAMATAWFVDLWGVRLAAGLLGAAALFAMTYMFCMIVGSVEYDKEERVYRLSQAFGDLRRYTERVRHDLARARGIQQRMLPDLARMPVPDRLTWAGCFCPETDVGGDYYDATAFSDGAVAIVFADVSGHGMAAAFITVIIKTAFEHWTEHAERLGEFVRLVNRNLLELTPDDSFAAMIAGEYDPKSRQLRYVNCGHAPSPVLIPADPAGSVTELTDGRTMVLGITDDPDLTVATHSLTPGDRLLMATDGITEALNTDGDMYGRHRLLRTLESLRGHNLDQMVKSLLADVSGFAEDTAQMDDRTVLAFEVR